jgi:excisionase family DNA binding protein
MGEIEMTPKGNAEVRRGYRIAEAADYMGVSPWFVELKVRSKELPALKLCRHYTILKEDMDAFLDAQRSAA